MARVGGASVNDHLAVVRKKLGRASTPPDLPEAARFAWAAFVDLSGARQAALSLQPIPYSEIAAYQATTRRDLCGWEVDAIRGLDDLYLQTIAEAEKKKGRPT